MNYSVYKFLFDTPVHLGTSDTALNLESATDHLLADTLFSALCQEALKLKGPQGPELLYEKAKNGKIVLSDTMPWQEDQIYLPKPTLTGKRNISKDENVDPRNRKALKNINWIALNEFDTYVDALKEGERYIPHKAQFGEPVQFTRVSILELPEKYSDPYYVGAYEFYDQTGLYFILGYEDEEDKKLIESLLKGLEYSGIGGKISSGLGKFHVKEKIDLEKSNDPELKSLLDRLKSQSNQYMLLTTSLPTDSELDQALEDASFSLIRRSGFIQSEDFSNSLVKKKTQFFLNSGSVLSDKYEGDVYNVAPENFGSHPVYRYSMPIFLKV